MYDQKHECTSRNLSGNTDVVVKLEPHVEYNSSVANTQCKNCSRGAKCLLNNSTIWAALQVTFFLQEACQV